MKSLREGMSARFANIDHDTPLLLPPDLRGGFEQSYNAQAAVEVESMLIVGQHVTHHANDKQQLIPTLTVVGPVIIQVSNVLVDSRYYSGNSTLTTEADCPDTTVYATMKPQRHGRGVAQLEARADPPRIPLEVDSNNRLRFDQAATHCHAIHGGRPPPAVRILTPVSFCLYIRQAAR